MIKDNTPVVVGVGQSVSRDAPREERFLSALDLAADAARRAFADTGADIPDDIDVMYVSRLFEDSTRKVAIVSNPFGASNNVPGSIAKRIGINPNEQIYCAVGGQTPQRLVNQMSEKIHRGEIRSALLVGGEAIANLKAAARQGLNIDLNETIDGECTDLWPRNNADKMVSDYEMAHGVFLPVQAYGLFENAWRHKSGHSVSDHRNVMGRLFAAFSKVAANNPYSQFPVERTAEFLASPSEENYLLSEPYTKWFVAQDAVNQGAAVFLTSAGQARSWGIPEHRWVSLHGYGDCDDLNVIERPDLALSQAQNLAVGRALDSSEKTIGDIQHIDAYSCFPIAVLSACEAMKLDPATDRSLTLTGGLPFFGGPGNNYSMHGIAEAVTRVRSNPGSFALVIANGGYLSKHSAGVYGPPAEHEWQSVDSGDLRETLHNLPRPVVTESPGDSGVVESYVCAYRRGEPSLGYIVGRTDNDQRFLAVVDSDDRETLMALTTTEPMGRKVTVDGRGEVNTFRFATA